MVLHINKDSLRIEQAIMELRFKEVFSLPELKFKLMERLSPKFPQYDISKQDQIALFDHERQIHVFIQLNRLVLDWVTPPSFEEFVSFATEVCSLVANLLNIDTFLRTGIRTMFAADVQSPQQATEYIFQKFINPNVRKPLASDELSNPSVGFSGHRGAHKYIFNLRYQEVHQIEGVFAQAGYTPSVNSKKMLMYDIDVFRDTNMNSRSLPAFCGEVTQSVTNDWLKYIAGLEV